MRMVKIALIGIAFLAFGSLAQSAHKPHEKTAQHAEAPASTTPPSLEGVTWADAPISYDVLRGKTVVLLVYVPERMNNIPWPAEFFQQLRDAVRDKPVVVLAIDAGKKAQSTTGYMNEMKFLAPNIIHGHDPLMPARLELKSEQLQFALINPEGKVVQVAATAFFSGKVRRFVLPANLAESTDLGSFTVLDPDMTAGVKKLLWPLELDRIPPESSLKAARRELTEKEQQSFDKALERFLTTQVERIEKLSQGKPAERLLAYDKAAALCTGYKDHPQAEKAKVLGRQLVRDANFQHELAARKAYDRLKQETAKNVVAQSRALANFAKLYKGTYYGDLAANDGKIPADDKLKSIRTWPVMTDAEQKAALAEQRAFYEKVREKMPSVSFQDYETKRFLFYSDIPSNIITKMYLPYLDQMYGELCKMYSLDPNTNIWKGKLPIYAFANGDDFQQFEKTFYGHTMHGAQGLCHQESNGNVLTSCYAGPKPIYLAVVMVHETTHGFAFRYKSADHLPNWLDEGAADWIANRVVGGSDDIARRVTEAIKRMQMTRSLGGNYFTAQNIEAWQYGAAVSMTDFLLNYDPSGRAGKTSSRTSRAKSAANNPYRKMIEAIKLGMPWEEALQQVYKLTPAQLAQLYGQTIGIPDLQP